MLFVQRVCSLLRGALVPGAFVLVLCAASPAAAQNVVTNGDFETPNVDADIVAFDEGASFGGWTVESNSINLVGTVVVAASGNQSVELNGNQRGAIFQDEPDTAGQIYILRFAMAGDPDGGPKVKQMEVWWGATLVDTLSFDTTGLTRANMGWKYHTYTVVGSGSDRLRFVSLTDGTHGPFLDNASVVPIALAKLTLNPSTVPGCKNVTGKVFLSTPAPSGGAVVTLTNTNPAATVPASVTVPAGKTSKTFTITTVPVTTTQTGTVTATYNGFSLSKTLKVRPITVQSVLLLPNPVVGGNTVNGQVTLECAAAPGDIVVTLSSANPAVANPTVTSLTIPAGSISATFTVSTSPVSSTTLVAIKAKANGITRSRTLTVTP